MQISPELGEFFKDVDFLVGNFEATITDKEKGFMQQKHTKEILATLETLCPPKKFVLACANNHSGDFGWAEFNKSYELLKDSGFLMIGRRDEPSILLNDQVNITACTAWSNQPDTPYIIYLNEADEYFNTQADFNVLFTHWGYEVQLYPNPKQIDFAKNLLQNWDLITGHHSHCPQPITAYDLEGTRKVIAYSLGDFCMTIKYKKYHWGMVAKMELGPGNGKWEKWSGNSLRHTRLMILVGKYG